MSGVLLLTRRTLSRIRKTANAILLTLQWFLIKYERFVVYAYTLRNSQLKTQLLAVKSTHDLTTIRSEPCKHPNVALSS